MGKKNKKFKKKFMKKTEPSDEMLEHLDVLLNMDLLEEQELWGELAEAPIEESEHSADGSI